MRGTFVNYDVPLIPSIHLFIPRIFIDHSVYACAREHCQCWVIIAKHSMGKWVLGYLPGPRPCLLQGSVMARKFWCFAGPSLKTGDLGQFFYLKQRPLVK